MSRLKALPWPAGNMDRNQIERKVAEVLSTVLKRPLNAGSDIDRRNTPQWDSLKHVEIMFALEEELGIEFSEDELAGLNSAAMIVDAVNGKYEA